ncbi:hypothetical protein OU994_16550 [Pseudoduganella sp. SL102]|uniref:hypothetical protein n=1 Tax=Pseudoduganella sp. SL102 TaxID=2995154 RepID=UPI00248B1A3A|nr:hypothetical protein [Pseudoduganella sp. SL102]WBR99935.1 hypothetical protein OU994_16550 [Pseudoduganella sp. SL102]
MIAGTPYSPGKAFLAFARQFIEHLASGEYGQALGKLDTTSQRWSKDGLRRALRDACGDAPVTSPHGLTQSASPSLEEVAFPEYLLKHPLPLSGKWGRAHAVFRFRQKPGTSSFHVDLVSIERSSR